MPAIVAGHLRVTAVVESTFNAGIPKLTLKVPSRTTRSYTLGSVCSPESNPLPPVFHPKKLWVLGPKKQKYHREVSSLAIMKNTKVTRNEG